MKLITILFLLSTTIGFSQISIKDAKTMAKNYNMISYSYHQPFEGHKGYAAPIIITNNNGILFFGNTKENGIPSLMHLNSTGELVWTTPILKKHDEMEIQSVVQDLDGNFYAFLLSYKYSAYRGGSERVIKLDSTGKIKWDIILGEYGLVNSPHCSYIKLHEDGRISLRGHVVTDKAVEGKDPEYKSWQGWLNTKGELIQKIGTVIDWSNSDWKKFLEVDVIVITETNIKDLDSYVGKTITIKGIVKNSKVPTLLGIDIEKDNDNLDGKMVKATGILKKNIVTKADPYSANRGVGTFYRLIDPVTNNTVQVNK